MKIVIAIDSFKGSMSSMEAGYAAEAGIRRAFSGQELPEIVVKPLADGGEGTTEALVEGLGGAYREVQVTGPMGTVTCARYGIMPDGKTAVMEMAEAAGIILVDRRELDPWKASTSGVGEMILDAIEQGCRKFIIGIGGSATTEGGIGMLTALGYRFMNEDGQVLPPIFESLSEVSSVDDALVPEILKECSFRVACDVKNPLYGEDGSVYVYGPQKGVREEERAIMDRDMKHYARVSAGYNGEDYSHVPGAGAAGGLGFAFLTYLPGAELASGIQIVLDAIHLEEDVKNADYVITGEGRLDAQTANGKVPVGVAHLAKKYGAKVLAFAGGVTDDAIACNTEGIDAFFPVVRGITTLDEAMMPERARKNMTLAVEQVFRLF